VTIVYYGGREQHLGSEQLYRHVKAIDAYNRTGKGVMDITDDVAQTIAAMWHSPNGESTWLSTRGIVTEAMTIGDFCTEKEYSELSTEDTLLIDYLQSYIENKQERA